jgi:hypothetical protein
MSSDDNRAGRDELQFDRVETGAAPTDASTATAGPSVICAMCGRAVGSEYYHVNDNPVCANCRDTLIAAAQTPRTVGPLLRAGLFGVVAAIAGAAIYYAIIAITNFEIGLVAILIGYMVGYGVRKGARGSGGRRFQVLALVLTYWAVGLAYTPIAFKELTRGEKPAPVQADSTTASADSMGSDSTLTSVPSGPLTGSKFLLGLGLGLVFVFALPIMYIIGSFPGGLLSALIIGIGLHQAWSMTGRHKLSVSGPYKIGTGPNTPADQPAS